MSSPFTSFYNKHKKDGDFKEFNKIQTVASSTSQQFNKFVNPNQQDGNKQYNNNMRGFNNNFKHQRNRGRAHFVPQNFSSPINGRFNNPNQQFSPNNTTNKSPYTLNYKNKKLSTNIENYFHASMLEDPWKNLLNDYNNIIQTQHVNDKSHSLDIHVLNETFQCGIDSSTSAAIIGVPKSFN